MLTASTYADSVFHGLAFIPVSPNASAASRAASLHDPAYVETAKRTMPRDAWSFLEEDASVLSLLFEPERISHAVAFLAVLHPSIDAFASGARGTLWQLGPEDVASTGALDALRALPVEPVEIFRAGLALAARAFEAAHAEALAPGRDQAARLIDARLDALGLGLELTSVELSATLGLHGRGFPGRVIVGHAVDDPDSTILLAIHEIVVSAAMDVLLARGLEAGWAHAEPLALVAGEQLLASTELERAFRAWASSLDRSGLAPPPDRGIIDEVCARLTGGGRGP